MPLWPAADVEGYKRALYLEGLVESHPRKIRVTTYDQNEKPIGSMTEPIAVVEAGQVDVDGKQDITRRLSVDLVDRKGNIDFAPNSAASKGLYLNRFVGVELIDWIKPLNRWVTCPVFMGPLSRFRRRGHNVQIEAQGKEALLAPPCRVNVDIKIDKNEAPDYAVRKIAKQVGEEKFDFSGASAWFTDQVIFRPKVPRAFTLRAWRAAFYRYNRKKNEYVGSGYDEGEDPWSAIKMICHAFYQDVFYDGRGFLVIRDRGQTDVMRFSKKWQISPGFEVDYDLLRIRNSVVVRGGKGRGRERGEPIAGTWEARNSNPVSAHSLRRNGKSRYLTEYVVNENIHRDSSARKLARQIGERLMRTNLEITGEALVAPFLEPYDLVDSVIGEADVEHYLEKFTIPLVVEGTMSIGANKRKLKPKEIR